MNMRFIKSLIGKTTDNNKISYGLLALRIFISVLLMTHGYGKIVNYETLSNQFTDFLGIGAKWNLILVILAEVGCSILIILGLFTRLSALPIMFSMIIAAFIAHKADPFHVKEMAILYLGLFTFILYTGAGKFSADNMITKKRKKK